MYVEIMVAVVLGLTGIIGWLFHLKFQGWDNLLKEHEERITSHDIHIATMNANLEHIRATGDETRDDVKELLERNGNRAAG